MSDDRPKRENANVETDGICKRPCHDGAATHVVACARDLCPYRSNWAKECALDTHKLRATLMPFFLR